MWEFLSWFFSKRKRDAIQKMFDGSIDDSFSEIVFEGEDFSISVRLFCSCQNPVSIELMDDDYEPALPHFICKHCDRVCEVPQCQICKVYSKMTDARLATTED